MILWKLLQHAVRVRLPATNSYNGHNWKVDNVRAFAIETKCSSIKTHSPLRIDCPSKLLPKTGSNLPLMQPQCQKPTGAFQEDLWDPSDEFHMLRIMVAEAQLQPRKVTAKYKTYQRTMVRYKSAIP